MSPDALAHPGIPLLGERRRPRRRARSPTTSTSPSRRPSRRRPCSRPPSSSTRPRPRRAASARRTASAARASRARDLQVDEEEGTCTCIPGGHKPQRCGKETHQGKEALSEGPSDKGRQRPQPAAGGRPSQPARDVRSTKRHLATASTTRAYRVRAQHARRGRAGSRRNGWFSLASQPASQHLPHGQPNRPPAEGCYRGLP